MMDSITVGANIRMTEAVTGDYPVGSTATILYIDEMDNVFIEWSDGKLSKFSDKQVIHGFEKITPKYSAPIQEHIERITHYEKIMAGFRHWTATHLNTRSYLVSYLPITSVMLGSVTLLPMKQDFSQKT